MTDLSLARVAEAATVIDPAFRDTPQYRDPILCERVGRPVLTKIETLNPLRSFKGRGAQFLMDGLDPGTTVVCGSSGGNFGQAVAHAATARGLRSEVFLSTTTKEGKRERTAAFGGRIHVVDGSPKAAARAFAEDGPARLFVEDGQDPAIGEGAGTIGMELARDGGFDVVVLPLGDGALITGVALWLRSCLPGVRVVGVTAAAAPAPEQSWRAGEPVEVVPSDVFAAGISITRPTADAVRRMRALVDDVVLVSGDQIRRAMRLARDTLGVLPEPAGAAGLAAVAELDLPGSSFATVLTGANLDADDLV